MQEALLGPAWGPPRRRTSSILPTPCDAATGLRGDHASGLAVSGTFHDARLASGCWSGAAGRAFHPQDSDERSQIRFLHLFLLSQASCRNHIDRGSNRGFPRRVGRPHRTQIRRSRNRRLCQKVVARETHRETTLSWERVASARVRIEPASVSPRHPRRRVAEQVAQLHQVTSTWCTKPQVTIAADVVTMMAPAHRMERLAAVTILATSVCRTEVGWGA